MITKSVVSTPVHMDVKLRVAHGTSLTSDGFVHARLVSLLSFFLPTKLS